MRLSQGVGQSLEKVVGLASFMAVVWFEDTGGDQRIDELRRRGKGNIGQDRTASSNEAGRQHEEPEPEDDEESGIVGKRVAKTAWRRGTESKES